MVEYGGGIEHGPAGQVGGGNPPVGGGGGVDLGASVGDFVGNAVNTVSTMEPTALLLLVVGILFGLALLRRAL
jgi:hypothetical protein